MASFAPIPTTVPDQLFTVTVNLMWQLYYDADGQRVPWARDDLLVAMAELELGPWQPLGPTPELDGVPFTVLCNLLDQLLAELARVTPGFGARIALARARAWLDPEHRSQPLS